MGLFIVYNWKGFLVKEVQKTYKTLTILEVLLSQMLLNVSAYELNFCFYFRIFNNFLTFILLHICKGRRLLLLKLSASHG